MMNTNLGELLYMYFMFLEVSYSYIKQCWTQYLHAQSRWGIILQKEKNAGNRRILVGWERVSSNQMMAMISGIISPRNTAPE